MTPEEFKAEMEKLDDLDIEERHSRADDLMGNVLIELGYGEGVEVFDSMVKWYA